VTVENDGGETRSFHGFSKTRVDALSAERQLPPFPPRGPLFLLRMKNLTSAKECDILEPIPSGFPPSLPHSDSRMRRRILAVLLLICLFASRANAVPAVGAAGASNAPRPWAQKFYPFSLRYRQQASQRLLLSWREPAVSPRPATATLAPVQRLEDRTAPPPSVPTLLSLLMRLRL
jgi:hypothetical protein